KKYRGKSLKIFPTYGDSATAGTCDLAVVELADEVKGISPAVINTAFNELGANVVGVGFGASGIAGKPSTVKFRNKKIAGENIIDSLAGYELNGVSTLLQCDFDHPTNAECNQMGTALPRPLEYICTGGDSGGGLFRQTVNGWELVGICSGSAVNIDRLMKTGYYGQVMSWTRVSVFNDWIFENFR
ncbi:MAG TPA: trypsin-like serine protease, partial [Patescibacteria group bacterium]|nr:trypsin-like serine protease [Patescibacteria group bacterium]